MGYGESILRVSAKSPLQKRLRDRLYHTQRGVMAIHEVAARRPLPVVHFVDS